MKENILKELKELLANTFNGKKKDEGRVFRAIFSALIYLIENK